MLLTLLLVVALIAGVVAIIRGEGPATAVGLILVAAVLVAGRL